MAEAQILSIDGELLEPGEATISALDDGLLRGDGAFEMIRVYGGYPFTLDEHLARLAHSAAAIELDYDEDALRSEIRDLLADSPGCDAGLRLVVTRGGRRIAMLEKIPEWAATTSIALLTYTPNEILTGVKSISYAANMQAGRLAAARGAAEAVFVRPDGIVLEAPTSSIFWVGDDDRLRTPAIETGILASITREQLLDVLETEEGHFDVGELRAAKEAFLASTTREVQAIATIDGAALAAAPGPRTREARALFSEIVTGERAAAAQDD